MSDQLRPLDIKGLPRNHVQPVEEAIQYLKKEGENPAFYSFELHEIPEKNELMIDLWHKDRLLPKFKGYKGDPTGKCRTLIFDRRQGKVVKASFWR